MRALLRASCLAVLAQAACYAPVDAPADAPADASPSRPHHTAAMPPASPADYYVIRLRPGQDLGAELRAFAKTHDLRAAFVASAVGSLTDVHLRYANQDTGARLSGHFEIVSLSGTLSADGMHVHLSVADGTGAVTGGHLLDGSLVYTTAELVIGEATGLRFGREVDSTYGYRELTVRRRRRGPGQAPYR